MTNQKDDSWKCTWIKIKLKYKKIQEYLDKDRTVIGFFLIDKYKRYFYLETKLLVPYMMQRYVESFIFCGKIVKKNIYILLKCLLKNFEIWKHRVLAMHPKIFIYLILKKNNNKIKMQNASYRLLIAITVVGRKTSSNLINFTRQQFESMKMPNISPNCTNAV